MAEVKNGEEKDRKRTDLTKTLTARAHKITDVATHEQPWTLSTIVKVSTQRSITRSQQDKHCSRQETGSASSDTAGQSVHVAELICEVVTHIPA